MARSTLFFITLAIFATACVNAASDCIPGCRNGGVCTAIEGLADEFFCKCPPGFMGADCTAVYLECNKGLVCYNGGKCTSSETPGQEECACPPKWTGATCKVPVDTCGNTTTFACMNGGTCAFDATLKEPYCKCPPNVRGRHCQFGVRECKDGMYCMNDGVCSPDGLSCQCPSSFFGFHCQNNERDPNAGKIARGSYIPPWAIALIAIGAVLTVAGAAVAGFLIYRERKGRPYFNKQWQSDMSSAQI